MRHLDRGLRRHRASAVAADGQALTPPSSPAPQVPRGAAAAMSAAPRQQRQQHREAAGGVRTCGPAGRTSQWAGRSSEAESSESLLPRHLCRPPPPPSPPAAFVVLRGATKTCLPCPLCLYPHCLPALSVYPHCPQHGPLESSLFSLSAAWGPSPPAPCPPRVIHRSFSLFRSRPMRLRRLRPIAPGP